MALSLNFSAIQQNDNLVLTITDTSTGWGTETDPNYTAIEPLANLTYALTLDITLLQPSESDITFDTIDLGAYGPFAAQSDMVFTLDTNVLKVAGNPYSVELIALPDGVYEMNYKVVHYTGTAWAEVKVLNVSYLLNGIIKNKVYNKLRQIPVIYANKDYANKREVMDAIFAFGYLDSLEKSAYIARKEELLTTLETLNRFYLNGSYFTW